MLKILKPLGVISGAVVIIVACTSQGKKKSEAKGSAKTETFATGPVGWVAWGDLRGNIEPCGCDIKINFGGYKRINGFVTSERKKHPQMWAFSLGNTLADTKDVKGATTSEPFLLESLSVTKPTAALFNKIELEKSYSIEKTLLEKKFSIPYILTNVKGNKAPNAFVKSTKVIKQQKLIVLGYTWDNRFKDKLISVSPGLINSWKKLLGQYKDYEKVLLFSGPKNHLQQFMDADIFRTVVASNDRKFGELADAEDVKNISDITNKFSRARVVMEVPLGGQGVIAGGVVADPYRPKKGGPGAGLFGNPTQSNSPFGASNNTTPKGNASFSFEDLSPIPVWLPPEMEDKKAGAKIQIINHTNI